jgi:hypothetical protein
VKPGRELDALVAEKVMGWVGVAKRRQVMNMGETIVLKGLPRNDADALIEVPRYSTRIDDAWRVVEHLATGGLWLDSLEGKWEEMWRCTFGQHALEPGYGQRYHQGTADTAPHAICLAALAAVEQEAA